ncbi:DNA mismatch repair protein MutS [Natranaerobius thermophilus]|uniref:DNA mismatch repair protein MutS n=1 Tax=Natranaerobius thermophilus (strain ATCC BAA-1301 / DSM 18059 / JW/NM-WN-LF) TaxID=457570 RepID=B2A3X7_NATTJ|nr:DNA mismatch repair protein MutS [Natranaerobius thermophilus]ACB85079.1 DNA mismatch repair protein MutS [Natranaerobius thermophilus JW/NM-WN-LF]
MAKNTRKITPMIQQYLDIKEEYPDAILFFRVGDFYEMFFEDAELAAKELEIVLTKRSVDKKDSNPIPLAGIPYHSCETYIGKLLDKGYKVAICEQVEDPQQAKGIVKREVVQLITPGTVLDSNFLKEKEHNFLVGLCEDHNYFGLATVDVSTGDFFVTEISKTNYDKVIDEILTVSPREIIIDEEKTRADKILSKLKNYGILVTNKSQPTFNKACDILKSQFNVESLEGFGLADQKSSIIAGGFLVQYLIDTQKTTLEHLQNVKPYSTESYLVMDSNTRKNLELCETIRQQRKEGSLLWVLDKTLTAMGGRMLRNWIQHPLLNVDAINHRLQAVEFFLNFMYREELARTLKNVYDLERVLGKIIYDRATPKDLIALSNSLEILPDVKDLLKNDEDGTLNDLMDRLPDLMDLVELINSAIVPDPPATVKEGGIIKDGFDEELDKIKDLSRGGKEWIANLEAKEKERTGIKSLKVRYNKVFGYYIEVTKKNLDLVPEDYIRKQTLVNAERFVTPDLKEYEDKILKAEEEMTDLEYKIFQKIRSEVISRIKEIQEAAKILAELDCYRSLAASAAEYDFVPPQVDNSDIIDIKEGRHPVVERVSQEEPFVPNDTYLDNGTEQIALITGPNMAGKSTYMRQVALIIVMAQMGSYVPATSARIGIVDKIFTRVGAADDLVSGQSTFMVEMNEVANILNNATSNSFVILDEIGRGTSTFDGISIARAVVEYLHQEDKVACKTLFATHFHELIELADEFARVVNYSVSVKEEGDDMIFLREIEKGGTDRSYGVQVARLAGIPRKVIGRAKEILSYLESRETNTEIPMTGYQVTLDDLSAEKNKLIQELNNINPDELSPKDALDKIYELYDKAQKFKE